MFSADASGNLVLKERTRINVEKILWIYSPEEQKQKLAVMEQTLPPSAYRQLVELMDRYQTFTVAAKQAYSPDVAPPTVEDAIAQHEGLIALRKAHLGAEAAEAMFGREERLSHQLLAFMDLEKHEGLTMDEKVIKAQEMLSKSPELAAAYEKNRESPGTVPLFSQSHDAVFMSSRPVMQLALMPDREDAHFLSGPGIPEVLKLPPVLGPLHILAITEQTP